MAAEDTQTLVATLVASHGEQLRRFLLARVRHAADVPDMIQEVYLRMLRVPKVESIRSPEAYLFTVAQHVIQQHTLRQSAMAPSVEFARMLNSRHATRKPSTGRSKPIRISATSSRSSRATSASHGPTRRPRSSAKTASRC